MSLSGHAGVVFTVAFNNPYAYCPFPPLWWGNGRGGMWRTLVLTGSFDKTARIWDAVSGASLAALAAHSAEVVSESGGAGRWVGAGPGQVCGSFNGQGDLAVTGGMDGLACLWDVDAGAELGKLAVRVLVWPGRPPVGGWGTCRVTLRKWSWRAFRRVTSSSLLAPSTTTFAFGTHELRGFALLPLAPR